MEKYVVAIDPGTSKIVAMIAKRETSGKVSILRKEEVVSEKCIRRGCIYNVDMATEKITYLIDQLDKNYAKSKLHAPIERVYVSIGGQSLHTEYYSIQERVEGETVDQVLLNKINEKIKQYKPELYEVLEILTPEYFVDGQLTKNPRGTAASSIEARYQLIVSSHNLKNLIRKAVPERKEIAGYMVAPLSTAAVLSEKDKELGCALVEFGAGVTYVSVYKTGLLRYLVTIPLGGSAITGDICCLNVFDEEAEELKKKYGSAISNPEDMKKIPIDEGSNTANREIEIRNLNTIIEARIDEILENVIHQIRESGYYDSLLAGIVITGGGAMLRHLEESFRNKVNKNIRLAYPVANGINQPAEYSTIIGLLTLAKEDCLEVPDMVLNSNEIREEKEREREREKEKEKEREREKGKGNPNNSNNAIKPPKTNGRGIMTTTKNWFDKLQKGLFDESSDNENDNNENK